MNLSTANQHCRHANYAPIGFAGDAGTGGMRGQFYRVDTGEWIGDKPVSMEQCVPSRNKPNLCGNHHFRYPSA